MDLFRRIIGKRYNRLENERPEDIPPFSTIKAPQQIAVYFEFVFHPNKDVAIDCATNIHRALDHQQHFEHNRFYNAFRNLPIEVQDFSHFEQLDQDLREAQLCIASMNGSGFIREKAVCLMEQSVSGLTFPFLLARTADWVVSVRKPATQIIRKSLGQQNKKLIIKDHRQIEWLLTVDRIDLSLLYADLLEHVFSNENTTHILNELSSYSDANRFFIIKTLIARGNKTTELFARVLKDKNSTIRFLGIRAFIDSIQPEMHRTLLKDKNAQIRLYMINQISEPEIDLFLPEIQGLIHDDSKSIRTLSRGLLIKKGITAFDVLYNEQLQRQAHPGSIIGLAEIGSVNAVNQIIPFLKANQPKRRASALYALSLLDFDQAKKEAFHHLNDPSNSVKRTASKIILRKRLSSDLAILRHTFQLGNIETKSFCLALFSHYGGWSTAGDFLKGILLDDQEIRRRSSAFLAQWFLYSTRLGVQLSDADRAYVRAVYDDPRFKTIELARNIRKIMSEIPFVFGFDA